MFISHRLQLIYICVPRTGSNSFRRSMKEHDFHFIMTGKHSEHNTALQAREAIYPISNMDGVNYWEQYKKISFIRHPYDWVRSLYNLSETLDAWGEDNTKPFSEFLDNLELTIIKHWFQDEAGEMMLDQIYRMETDLEPVCHSYGVEPVHINKTAGKDPIELTDKHKEIIHDKFYRELAYYNVDIQGSEADLYQSA